jgi:hypothetical protein
MTDLVVATLAAGDKDIMSHWYYKESHDFIFVFTLMVFNPILYVKLAFVYLFSKHFSIHEIITF